MQELIVLTAVIIAGIYIFRHLRHTLTVGEKDSACGSCPVGEMYLKTKPPAGKKRD